jgi:hypothetical protein
MEHLTTTIEYQMSLITTLIPPLLVKNWIYREDKAHKAKGGVP